MNKYYNGLLLAVVLCSAVGGLIALEKLEKPSFRESTQEMLKITALSYIGSYGLFHSVGTGLIAPFEAACGTDWERCMAKSRGEKFSFGKTLSTFGNELKENVSEINRRLIRSHRIAAPVVFGSSLAWHYIYG